MKILFLLLSAPSLLAVTTVKMGIDAKEINQTMKASLPAARDCYDHKGKKQRGKTTLHIVINDEGKVRTVETSSTDMNPEMNDCLVGAVKELSFPKPLGGGTVEVTYPFVFSTDPAVKR